MPLRVGLPARQGILPAGGQLVAAQPVERRLALRVGRGPGVEGLLPLGLRRLAALHQLAGVRDDLVGDLEGLLRVETEDLLGGRDLVLAERRAVRLAGVLQVRAPASR